VLVREVHEKLATNYRHVSKLLQTETQRNYNFAYILSYMGVKLELEPKRSIADDRGRRTLHSTDVNTFTEALSSLPTEG